MFSKLKELCCKANAELPELGLVFYTFGNASCIDREKEVFAIKPSGVPYQELRRGGIPVVDLKGNVVSGDLKPSSDAPTHAVLYANFKNIGAVVHTHSLYATAWAQSQMDVPVYGTTHADHLNCDIPCTPLMEDRRINADYEYETGRLIVEYFHRKNLDPDHVPMVLVGGHGPFAWGKTPEKALYHARILEELCHEAYVTRTINPKVMRLKESLITKHFERKHGRGAYYGQQH